MSDPTVPPGPPPSSPPPPPSGPTPPPAAPPPGPSGAGPGAPPPPSGGGGYSAPPPSGGGGYGAPPPPAAPGGTESPNRGVMIVLSYLGLLALIPLLVEKDDREVQWHAKHGLVLTALWILVSIVLAIFTTLIAFMDFGCSGCVLNSLLGLVILVIHVLAIVKGLNGQRLIIPGVSQFADRF